VRRPFDAYSAQQVHKAEQLEASIRREERERIVALLEQEITEKTSAQRSADLDMRLELAQDIAFVRRLIALIKGETQ